MYVLPNISRSKGNQTVKFGHLLEYNTRNVFLKKFITWEIFFSKNCMQNVKKIKNEHISGSAV